jgi:hypothetical protein
MPAESEQKPVILDGERPLVCFVDTLQVATRTDGNHLVRFFASLPEGWSEQARIMIPDSAFKSMLDVLCKHRDSVGQKLPGSAGEGCGSD